MRLRAYLDMGIDDVWVSVVDAQTEKEMVEYALSDNDRAGYYDEEVLAELVLSVPDLDLSQFKVDLGDAVDLQSVIDKFGPTPEVIEDDVPEDVETRCQLGDVWQLGNHRLMCGDSTKIEDVEKLMNGQKADMVFTDPPYNIASDSKNFASGVSKAMKDLSESEWDKDFKIEDALATLVTAVKSGATIYVCTSHFLFSRVYGFLKDWAEFASYCVWNKPNPMPSLSQRHWTWNTELIVYATGKGHTFNFPKGSHALSVWTFNKQSDGTRPTQKPVELVSHAILHSSKEDDIVLDLFGGSGSTLIACEQTNRTCYMMELDPHYCDVIIQRWENLTGKTATLV